VHEHIQLLTEDETASILKVSPGTLRNRRCEGRGPPFVKLGSTVRYRPVDLQDYIESCLRRGRRGRSTSEPTVLTLDTRPASNFRTRKSPSSTRVADDDRED
jgi:hypothetical protein